MRAYGGGVVALLLLALAAAGCGGGESSSTTAAPADETPPVTSALLVPLDPDAAARIPISGATAAEEEVARTVLAGLGSEPGVERVTFSDGASGRAFDVETGAPAVDPQADGSQASWLVGRAGAAIASSLPADPPVAWTIDGQPLVPTARITSPPPDGFEAMLAGAADEAAAAGVSAAVRGYRVGPGIVTVTVTVRDGQPADLTTLSRTLIAPLAHEAPHLDTLLLVADSGGAMQSGTGTMEGSGVRFFNVGHATDGG